MKHVIMKDWMNACDLRSKPLNEQSMVVLVERIKREYLSVLVISILYVSILECLLIMQLKTFVPSNQHAHKENRLQQMYLMGDTMILQKVVRNEPITRIREYN